MIDKEPVLRVGMRLEVMRKGTQQAHYAKIEDVGIWEYAISSLYGGSEVDVLEPGEEVECFFADPEGHVQYGFVSVVLRREVRTIPLYFLSLPRIFDRVQRRRFVRYPVLLPAQYRLSDDQVWSKGFLVDISGGGARLSHKGVITSEELVRISFPLKQYDPSMILAGRIVRSDLVQEPNMYHSGVEFLDITIAMQDRIVGFIFQRMLEQRRSQEW